MILVSFPSKPFNVTVIQVYVPTTNTEEAEVDQFCEDLQDLQELTKKKEDSLFLIRDQNEKVGSQEIPGVTGKFGLGAQNEAGQRLKEFCQDSTLFKKPFLNNTRDDSAHGNHQMINTKIRLLIFSAAEDGQTLYRQQKQDLELTVAQIIRSLFKTSGFS